MRERLIFWLQLGESPEELSGAASVTTQLKALTGVGEAEALIGPRGVAVELQPQAI